MLAIILCCMHINGYLCRVLITMYKAMTKKVKATPRSSSASRAGRKSSMTPSAPKAGVTGRRTRYGCGGKLK